MPTTSTKESVSVSFHFFEKGVRQEDGQFKPSKFLKQEFDALVTKIEEQPEPNLDVPNDFDGVKFGRIVPFLELKHVDDRTFFGQFRSAYWGHSFENTEKGKIAAETLNLRNFCFLLYYSESGRIYLGCQYLGNYGDYGSLSRSLLKMLGLGSNARSCSYFSEAEDYMNTIPQEVRVTLSSNSEALAAGNVFNSGSMVAFKKSGKDEVFELTVREKLLSMVGQPVAEIKKQVAAMLSKNELFSVDDEDIRDCVVTVRKKKSRGTKTVYLFGQSTRATKFHLDVELDDDGWPILEKAKVKMLNKLEEEIINKVMDD
ncbi:hypothetical protein MACH17_19860 [Phaeobacter inhibens]|uniref:hypothetical protein n=1 Tax=Phaeobacter inhibens TaxID=221822 RepID=UPI00275AF423|nr:hypothetical protein [Phaeobacter inhibens]GLO70469.1 hypothetical protein MACH17_19860 [Phaeobacter inhibens]